MDKNKKSVSNVSKKPSVKKQLKNEKSKTIKIIIQL